MPPGNFSTATLPESSPLTMTTVPEDTRFETYSPSFEGSKAIPHGALPAETFWTTVFLVSSITETEAES